MLVVHARGEPAVPSHSLTVLDWYHVDHVTLAVRSGYAYGGPGSGDTLVHHADRMRSTDGVELTSMRYESTILGGRGRWRKDLQLPLSRYRVSMGASQQRFRLVHAGAEYSYLISVDCHVLRILALDGFPVQPVTTDFIIVHPGESVDFEAVFRTDQQNSTGLRYWMRANTLRSDKNRSDPDSLRDGGGLERPNEDGGLAILDYRGSFGLDDPTTEPRICSGVAPCTVFNCPFSGYPSVYHMDCIAINRVKSPDVDRKSRRSRFGLNDAGDDVTEIFLNFAFVVGSSVNGRRFVHPRSFLPDSQDDVIDGAVVCDENLCNRQGCACTHVISVPPNVTVQMVLLNYQPVHSARNLPSHHSVHIHGHSFAVLATGFARQNSTTGLWTGHNQDISCAGDRLCARAGWRDDRRPSINLVDPPIKDTVIVPARGYTVVRFRADNPGRWLIHCHQEMHSLKGMALILDVRGGAGPDPPAGFPSCRSSDWIEDEDKKLVSSVASSNKTVPGLESRNKGFGDDVTSHVCNFNRKDNDGNHVHTVIWSFYKINIDLYASIPC